MKHDELIRQALQRQNNRAAGMKMPNDMEQRVMDRIKPKKTSYRWLYSFSIGAIAASVLLLLMFHFSGKNVESKEKPVIAQQTEQRDNTTKDEVTPKIEHAQQQALQKEKGQPTVSIPQAPVVAQNATVNHTPTTNNHSALNTKSAPVAAANQLNDYIARLEVEMEALDDSVRAAHLEKLIAADDRLQRLVNSILKDDADQALRELQKDSTANYIYF